MSEWVREKESAYSDQQSFWVSAPAGVNVSSSSPHCSAGPSSPAPGSPQTRWTSAHGEHKKENEVLNKY